MYICSPFLAAPVICRKVATMLARVANLAGTSVPAREPVSVVMRSAGVYVQLTVRGGTLTGAVERWTFAGCATNTPLARVFKLLLARRAARGTADAPVVRRRGGASAFSAVRVASRGAINDLGSRSGRDLSDGARPWSWRRGP